MVGEVHGGGRTPKITLLNLESGNYSDGDFLGAKITNDSIGVLYKFGIITLPPGSYRVTAVVSAGTLSAGRLWVTLEQKAPINKRLVGAINYGNYATVNFSHIISSDEEIKLGLNLWSTVYIDRDGTGPSTWQIEELE